ncbi:HNH endonuclease [Clostridium estertheticum]|uniref:HNH endonuclease n=1 Tax=Clostridium estertheticum TaxID=238834 RepID=A0AA47EKX3_9CLOT|nr:HNH endonuclease [Clostridium estertheticum]MBU3154475.1 HNH endonuclease [Clostridium estertheticum]WAG62086.1 HNH endonuclease [Clostridium estertheticum]
MENSKLYDEIVRLRENIPVVDEIYYDISISGTKEGKIKWLCQTQWVGFTDTKPIREIREAREVIPDKALKSYKNINEPAILVNEEEDIFLFMLFGGHAIIKKDLCRKFFENIITPSVAINNYDLGYTHIDSIEKGSLQRAPSKKLRMKVLKRDNFKCRLCGRSPNNYVDLELHVHHIFPWSQGGLTGEKNLITLCKTCHDGLDPHLDPELFSYIEDFKKKNNYYEDLINYHNVSYKLYGEITD